jgi:hypothetical protein
LFLQESSITASSLFEQAFGRELIGVG